MALFHSRNGGRSSYQIWSNGFGDSEIATNLDFWNAKFYRLAGSKIKSQDAHVPNFAKMDQFVAEIRPITIFQQVKFHPLPTISRRRI